MNSISYQGGRSEEFAPGSKPGKGLTPRRVRQPRLTFSLFSKQSAKGSGENHTVVSAARHDNTVLKVDLKILSLLSSSLISSLKLVMSHKETGHLARQLS